MGGGDRNAGGFGGGGIGFGNTGGGIAITDTGSVTVENTEFIDNEAATSGAALYAAGGSLTATGVTFDGNLPDDWFCETAATCSVSTAD